jgi:hypothetical protein
MVQVKDGFAWFTALFCWLVSSGHGVLASDHEMN